MVFSRIKHDHIKGNGDHDLALRLPNDIRFLAMLVDRPESGNTLTIMVKLLDIGDCYIQDIKRRLVRLKYIKTHKEGRKVRVTLTDRGRILAKSCSILNKLLLEDGRSGMSHDIASVRLKIRKENVIIS